MVPISLPTVSPSGRNRPPGARATGLHRRAGGNVGGPVAFPQVALLSSVGTLAVAAAYAAGREGWPYLSALYWPGQLLVFVPIALRAYSRRLTRPAEGFALLLLLFVQQTLLFRMYSPLALKFPDELQHWRGTVNVIQSGQLGPGQLLPPGGCPLPGAGGTGRCAERIYRPVPDGNRLHRGGPAASAAGLCALRAVPADQGRLARGHLGLRHLRGQPALHVL